MLRLPLKRVYRMFRAGELKSIKVDGSIRTCKLWIIEYIQKYGFIRQEKFHHERQAAVTVFCQTPKSRKQIQEFLDLPTGASSRTPCWTLCWKTEHSS